MKPPLYILGINTSHNSSACLLKDKTICSAIEEERLNKDKYSVSFKIVNARNMPRKLLPYLSISYLLREANTGLDDLDKIYITDCDLLDTQTITAAEQLLKQLLPVKDKSKIFFIPPSKHHLVHAYNAYYLSKFSESLILVMDAYVSEDDTRRRVFESAFYAKDNEITEIFTRDCDKGELGIGALYQFFCKLLDFNFPLWGELGYNYFGLGIDQAGKLMGLAAYGRNSFFDDIVKKRNGKLSIRIKDLYNFALKYSLIRKIANPGYLDEMIMSTKQKLFMPSRVLTDYSDKFVQNLAYFAQRQLEKAILILIESVKRIRSSNNLCLSGGVALNCLANGVIKEKNKNMSIYVPFAPADNGNAIGACFWGYTQSRRLRKKCSFKNRTPFLGKEYILSHRDVLLAAQQARLNIKNFYINKLSKAKLAQSVVEFLNQDMIVAFINGASEFGPRALGHRSILANPFSETAKKYLNQFIKKREFFRPFAPAVLSGHKDLYFLTRGLESPHMSFSVKLKNKFRHLYAIKNVDNSSRLQTVDKRNNELFARVIKKFAEKTGVALLLNTSCNPRGFPLIENPLEILYLYRQFPVDIIVIDQMLIIPEYEITRDLIRYRNGELNDKAKEKLADSLYQRENYFRAQDIYEELFTKSKQNLYLFKIFKCLFMSPRSTELQRLFQRLINLKRNFLNNSYGEDIGNEYRIFMGLYELFYREGQSNCFRLDKLIGSQGSIKKRKVTARQIFNCIISIAILPGNKNLPLARKKKMSIHLFDILIKYCPEAINTVVFHRLLCNKQEP